MCSLSYNGDLETIQKILPECKEVKNGYNPVIFAIRGGRMDVIKVLVNHGFRKPELKELKDLPKWVKCDKIVELIEIVLFDDAEAAALLRSFFRDRREISSQLIKRLIDLDHPMLDETLSKTLLKTA